VVLAGNTGSRIKYAGSRPGDIPRLFADSENFRRLTGWEGRISFDEGLLRTIDWFRSSSVGVEALLEEEEPINWK